MNTLRTAMLIAALTALFMGVGFLIGGSSGMLIAFLIAAGMNFFAYWNADKLVLATQRAREVDAQSAPELVGLVRDLAGRAGLPMPRVYIVDNPQPNAFATGRNADKAVLCVTTELVDRLTPAELEGVIAHEMSHVAHKDVQVMTIASFLAIVAALLIRFSFYGELFGGGGRGRGGNNNNGGALPILLIIMGVSIAVYAISFVLIRLLSRYRELAADRSGALLTGQPSALKSALVKVSEGINRIPTRDLRAAEGLNAFFFAPAMKLNAGASLSKVFSTHPSLERRLAELDKVQQQLGRTAG